MRPLPGRQVQAGRLGASLGQRRRHHVRGSPGRGQRLGHLNQHAIGVAASAARDLAVLTLRDQEPGELLAQLGQLVAHQRQLADDLAGLARTGQFPGIGHQLVQRPDSLHRLRGDLPDRHRGGQLVHIPRCRVRPGPGQRGSLGVITGTVRLNFPGHLSPWSKVGAHDNGPPARCAPLHMLPRRGHARHGGPEPTLPGGIARSGLS